MQETQTLPDTGAESLEIIEKPGIPIWLVLVYLSLLVWSVWNILKYWD
jgi:hypothetical protein